MSDATSTAHSQKRPIRKSTRIGAPGTARRPQPEAAATPDEDVAAELEHSAARAQARGGVAAAAAFLERAAALSPEPSRRAQRALAAAQTKFQAGALDDARALLDSAASGAPTA